MRSKEKYDLAAMLKEIDDDLQEQKKDICQKKNIPQETITELMINRLMKRKKQRSPENRHARHPEKTTKH